jgi:hypothetical protein
MKDKFAFSIWNHIIIKALIGFRGVVRLFGIMPVYAIGSIKCFNPSPFR